MCDGRQALARAIRKTQPAAGIDGSNALERLVRTDGAILVVPAIAGTIRGGHIELNEVDVLTDDVGRGSHLEIVELIDIGDQVGVVVRDAASTVHAKEEGLRWSPSHGGDGHRHLTRADMGWR